MTVEKLLWTIFDGRPGIGLLSDNVWGFADNDGTVYPGITFMKSDNGQEFVEVIPSNTSTTALDIYNTLKDFKQDAELVYYNGKYYYNTNVDFFHHLIQITDF